MNTTEAELQTEIKMGSFDKSLDGRLDSMNARNRMFDEVQRGHVILPIYRSPENPGNNPEIGAMLNHFSLDFRSLQLPVLH
ncbi:MAG: hypothetical protein P4L53_11510 [Candidatus Obscuribacterales bacterium]|nr:hypothetical protein [Candidatus Obscuribacterales bacterium]